MEMIAGNKKRRDLMTEMIITGGVNKSHQRKNKRSRGKFYKNYLITRPEHILTGKTLSLARNTIE